jgi:hypothetical protein
LFLLFYCCFYHCFMTAIGDILKEARLRTATGCRPVKKHPGVLINVMGGGVNLLFAAENSPVHPANEATPSPACFPSPYRAQPASCHSNIQKFKLARAFGKRIPCARTGKARAFRTGPNLSRTFLLLPDRFRASENHFERPDAISGHPETISGRPEMISGSPEKVSGHPEMISGSPEKISGHPETISGSPEKVSGHPEKISGNPGMISGHPEKDSGKRPKHATTYPLLNTNS